MHDKPAHIPTLSSYLIGYSLSVFLTLTAFGLAFLQFSDTVAFTGETLVFTIVTLALLQVVVQAVFFLHLSGKIESRYNLITFLFTVLIVVVIGVGSLWIMHNLDHNMTPSEIDAYLHKEN